MRRTRRLALATSIALAAPFASTAQAQQAGDDALERGRALTRAFHAGELAAVLDALSDEMRAAVGGAEGLASFRDRVESQLGAETERLNERVTRAEGHVVYHRSARHEKVGVVVATTWAFDDAGRVAGFSVRPERGPARAAPSRHLEYRTRTPLRLPFEGEWTVYWGGRTILQNYHAAYADQRFAYDLLVVEDGTRHRGEGTSNTDYHCFGRPILAPGAGAVVVARDGVPDNAPGDLETEVPPGNHVVLDHGNGEYSFLAHLRNGSVRVAPGDRVSAGDALGECGNSGRSSEPHLHYHLQDSPDFGAGTGLPAQFQDYVADGEAVDRGEPVRGQRIRPAP